VYKKLIINILGSLAKANWRLVLLKKRRLGHEGWPSHTKTKPALVLYLFNILIIKGPPRSTRTSSVANPRQPQEAIGRKASGASPLKVGRCTSKRLGYFQARLTMFTIFPKNNFS
jgi:hypothetical protein